MRLLPHHIILPCVICVLLCTILAFAVDAGGVVERCSENELAFGCKEEGTAVVVKEAWLHDGLLRVPRHKCHIPEYNVQFKKGSVLQHISKKCAMQRVCHFSVLRDVPGAKEEKERWNGHVVRVTYECIKETTFVRTCGEKLEKQEGWIQNVGYPKFYLGPGACTFTIIVDSGQKVNLQIYDLSTREIMRPSESQCNDYLAVTEGADELLRTCGNPNKPISVISRGNILNVTLHTSVNIYTKRGFLATFKAVGCPTPDIPEDGYLSHRNSTHAEFWCCVRHVYPDTMERVRTLRCKFQRYWDQSLPDCVDLEDLLLSGNISEHDYWRYNGSASTSLFFTDERVVYDIVLPGVIMASLILGNACILILIILCRRRVKECENPEELESIKANAEPTDIKEQESTPCQV